MVGTHGYLLRCGGDIHGRGGRSWSCTNDNAKSGQCPSAAAASPPAAATAEAAEAAEATHPTTKPNFVWLHVESTDGRTYQQDMKDLVPIPHIRSLMSRGANFVNAYANVPICCPSRASTWAGREGHNMKHTRKDSGLVVNGAWNNNEGFGDDKGGGFDALKISDRLQRDGTSKNHVLASYYTRYIQGIHLLYMYIHHI